VRVIPFKKIQIGEFFEDNKGHAYLCRGRYELGGGPVMSMCIRGYGIGREVEFNDEELVMPLRLLPID